MADSAVFSENEEDKAAEELRKKEIERKTLMNVTRYETWLETQKEIQEEEEELNAATQNIMREINNN